MRARDTQRRRVYRSEWTAFGRSECITPDEVLALVREVWEYAPLRKRPGVEWEPRPPRVSFGRGRRSWSYGGHICISRTRCYRFVVLHELAHELTYWEEPGHGGQWVETYLFLVEAFMGFDAAQKLRASFRENRVVTTKAAEAKRRAKRKPRKPTERKPTRTQLLTARAEALGARMYATGGGWYEVVPPAGSEDQFTQLCLGLDEVELVLSSFAVPETPPSAIRADGPIGAPIGTGD